MMNAARHLKPGKAKPNRGAIRRSLAQTNFGIGGLPTSRISGPNHHYGSNSFDRVEVMLAKWLLAPVVTVAMFRLSAVIFGEEFNQNFVILSVLAFLVTAHIFDETNLYRSSKSFPVIMALNSAIIKWAVVVSVILLVLYVTKLSSLFSRKVLLTWFAVTPIVLVLAQALVRRLLGERLTRQAQRRAVIIGANTLGSELYDRITSDAYLGIQVVGFFDDRQSDRLPEKVRDKVIGKISDAVKHVREVGVEQVFITLPIHLRNRLEHLIEELNDTTSSVYIVPDVHLFELVQARIDHLNGVPIVAVRDTPFMGMQGLAKRMTDIVLAGIGLICISPLLLLISIGVKLSSRGPVIFKQRRYGLDGEEILVYKFRSMSVCEDGEKVKQAVKNDARVTRFGAFLRKTSLDELPQLINVLQGRMSLVGPRPHAVAHNELYRKVISGYMIRHKVLPGITGWAQINGLRGETDTVDKMKARVEFDLDYIRNWSLPLDFYILLKTVKAVFRADAAY